MEDFAGRSTGNYIVTAFEALGITKAEFERRSGISPVSLRAYINGELPVRNDKRRQLCDAFGWTHDSIDRIERGQPPVMAVEEVEDEAALTEDLIQFETNLDALVARVEALERILGQRARGDQSA